MVQIDLKGMDKAMVLAALYNASIPDGEGFFYYDPIPMTVEEAREALSTRTKFDYISGRSILVDLSGDTLNTESYDFCNGNEGDEAQKAIDSAIRTGNVNNPEIQERHQKKVREAGAGFFGGYDAFDFFMSRR
ncbi:MAG: hypothetical protein EOM23_11085 [Candidatus Moranbacteria bacterium]|nr:hypothetical protein [Candidatus Moranbacteria bacterium]